MPLGEGRKLQATAFRPLTLALLGAGVMALLTVAGIAAQGTGDGGLAPANLTAEAVGCSVALAWDTPAEDTASVTGYRVLCAQGGAASSILVADTESTDTAYTDSTTESGETYAYRVKALRGEAASPESNVAEVELPPDPTPVEVTQVPIVVPSTTDDYFVLYVNHDSDGESWEIPVLVKLGEAGTTSLAENVEALPRDRYRVEKYLVADPADVDGDCIDDITELNSLGTMNPVNPTGAVAPLDGTVILTDKAAFDALAAGTSVRFVVVNPLGDRPGVYFVNSDTHTLHYSFLEAVGVTSSSIARGRLTHHAGPIGPEGDTDVYSFWTIDSATFKYAERTYTLLAANLALLDDSLALHLPNADLPVMQEELPQYRESRIDLLFDDDIHPDNFLALNEGDGYGRLRLLGADERPHPRDMVIYETLPSELPRVAGIISTALQTPLSHVNLRAVQDQVPNAFIRNALDDASVTSLVGSYVHYRVTNVGWSLSAATKEQVDSHYASSRPTGKQIPERDLSVTTIKSLSDIGFSDWKAFGVKAANVAVLGTLGFPEGTVPDGFAIPFYFYDEFMKHNDLYAEVTEMLADEDFQTDYEEQEDRLKDLRRAIRGAETPEWIKTALTDIHEEFPNGTSLRYRSSTNNEDLPNFNGAGLYDSKTQHPEETEEDGIDKSFKQVLASLWTFRAFTEREFHRIDHLAAAMGVLVHPNYSDELANGVAVSFDLTTGRNDRYYVNTQLGEDLITNPPAHSVPEELLVARSGSWYVLATSNLVEPGTLLMSAGQIDQLRRHLSTVHDRFKRLYRPRASEPFAMEIEFKITSDNILAVKQARPWVFTAASGPPPPPPKPSNGGGGGGGSSSGSSSSGSSPAPAPPRRSPIIGSTSAATAKELAGDLMVLQRHDQPGVEVEVGIGWISRDGQRIILLGFVRDGDLGQTFAVVRREGDGQVVRRWIAPDSHLIYAVPWPIVNTQFTFPVGVILAIPLDDQYPPPNMLARRFDGGDDRILAYDAELGQWRHVPDEGTFQTLGFYWCNVTAADAGFFDRITLGPPYPASNVPARADYPVCQT